VVLAKAVSLFDVVIALTLNQHVRFADRVGLGVQLLPEEFYVGIRIDIAEDMLLSYGQHAASAASGVVNSADHGLLLKRFSVRVEKYIHHKSDNLTRGEMITSRFIRLLAEAPNQLLEDISHFVVANDIWMQVNPTELFDNEEENIGTIKPLDFLAECKFLQDVLHIAAEAIDVGAKVSGDIVGIGLKLVEVEA
jgi:hypothetical protein